MTEDQNSKSFFPSEVVKELNMEYSEVKNDYEKFITKLVEIKLENEEAREYLDQGLKRRISAVKRCIDNIWSIYPPDREAKLTHNELYDATINLQAFIFNIFGCIDNLAWIFVKHTGHNYKNNYDVTIPKLIEKKLLSDDFNRCFEALGDWLDYLKNYRHALAHRIPLYITPSALGEKDRANYKELEEQKNKYLKECNFEKYDELSVDQERLLNLRPCFMHSFKEDPKPILFHYQILIDWKAIMYISNNFLKELSA